MMSREIKAVNCESHPEHTNALCGQNFRVVRVHIITVSLREVMLLITREFKGKYPFTCSLHKVGSTWNAAHFVKKPVHAASDGTTRTHPSWRHVCMTNSTPLATCRLSSYSGKWSYLCWHGTSAERWRRQFWTLGLEGETSRRNWAVSFQI